ncbi:hypothetical protein J2125_003929 [Erwinia toletana]|uniref:Uncharacterized protein n=1 Tax=Winslowiella toletana TaxID=92490 RepID=A0ABS4PEY0_9GAMM|nr:hypothetical protein [Winslowiella toletana]MBP2170737.1 hypothetical protein [Winslowiella toletana]
MTIRYLYGRKNILTPVINDKAGLRLSDLTHYSRMENENMQDNEMEKLFTVDRTKFNIFLGGDIINSDEMTADTIFNLTPRHCFCLCFSSRRDESELYKEFKADICIGFDVEKLREHLEIISVKFSGMKFQGRDVTYYHPGSPPNTFTPDELVFYKPSAFSHEAEYRLALFYPEDQTGFKTEDGTVIPFRMENKSMHMTVSHPKKGFVSECVTEVLFSKR